MNRQVPRPSRFTDEDVLDAALAAVTAHGRHITVAMIASRLGGPVGSIYHRFRSREAVLIRLWLRSIKHFQQGFLAAAHSGETPIASLLACAQYVPAYCREHPAEAFSLTLFRQVDLLAVLPPGAVREQVATVNKDVESVLIRLAAQHFGDDPEGIERVDLAVRTVPYGVVRGLVGGPIPQLVDIAVVAAARAVLEA